MDKTIALYMRLSDEDDNLAAHEESNSISHKTFATLSQEEQKYANIFLHDIQRGDVEVTVGKSLRD